MSDLPEDLWESRFQAGRTPWERGKINPAFQDWRASGALSPCRIPVPGAGKSPEPAALLMSGFDVMALGLAESAVLDQQARLGTGRAVLADVTSWQPAQPFDAVYDQTCLCALPPPLWPAYEANLRSWPPGSRLFILFMQTGREGGPPFDCPLPAMRSLFSAWNWPDALPQPLPHGLGTLDQPAVLSFRPGHRSKSNVGSNPVVSVPAPTGTRPAVQSAWARPR